MVLSQHFGIGLYPQLSLLQQHKRYSSFTIIDSSQHLGTSWVLPHILHTNWGIVLSPILLLFL